MRIKKSVVMNKVMGVVIQANKEMILVSDDLYLGSGPPAHEK